MIELTIPSSLDKTICVLKHPFPHQRDTQSYHIVQLFIQFVPYDVCIQEAKKYIYDDSEICKGDYEKQLESGSLSAWDVPSFKDAFVTRCFDMVDEFCPGFSKSIIYKDVLTPVG